MNKIYQQLLRTLRQFLRQRDHLLLLVPCNDGDVALLLSALRDLDRESATDLFLLFAEDFLSDDSFMSYTAQRLQEEHKLTSDAVGQEVLSLPPLPAELLDDETAPSARLVAGLHYARSLIDPGQGQHFVWGMGPAKISDPQSYLALLAQLVPGSSIQPWMRGARLVARVPADFRIELTPLAHSKRVLVSAFSIPLDIHESELLTVANNPKAPHNERAQAELQLAYLDMAYGRFDGAIAKFLKSLAFFQWADLPALEGLAISGLGDIARLQGDFAQAQHWYSCAIAPATQGRSPLLMSTIVQSLAGIAWNERRFHDAEARYAELASLRRAMLDEEGLAEALQWQGLSQLEQRAYDRAVRCWEEGALVCQAFELRERLPVMLTHLRNLYQQLDMRDELAGFDATWNCA
jgi:hypothetical protein